jgi:hypothetical protein
MWDTAAPKIPACREAVFAVFLSILMAAVSVEVLAAGPGYMESGRWAAAKFKAEAAPPAFIPGLCSSMPAPAGR